MKKNLFAIITILFFALTFCYAKNFNQTEFTMKEIFIKKNGKNIYGRFYNSENDDFKSKNGKPLVILSHGFGGSYKNTEGYAIDFAKNGISAFSYDFVGGGKESKSGNDTSKMSVLTEASDLSDVLDFFQNYDGIDKNRIFLLGESQGGFVSTYVAAKRPSDIAGLIALYPAYVLQDDSKKRNPNPEKGNETTNFWGITLGKIYDVDAQSFDIYDMMKNYNKKGLLIHGTEDSVVPISYSERAAKTFPDANLIIIKGANHGFWGEAYKTASENAIKFVKSLEK